MNLVCDVALDNQFNNGRKVIDFLHHISESCTYFKECHISKGILHILYFQIIPTISQKFDSNFLGPKLAPNLYTCSHLEYNYTSAFFSSSSWRISAGFDCNTIWWLIRWNVLAACFFRAACRKKKNLKNQLFAESFSCKGVF